jgi:hypothetical protein
VIFWTTGVLDNQLGGLFDSRSATGLGKRIMAVAIILWLLAAAIGIAHSGVERGT